MKNNKRIMSALILAVALNLIGCGNEPPVLNESDAIENAETVEDNTEATKEFTENMNEEMVGTDKPVEVETPNPAITPTNTPVPTVTSEPTPEATSTPASTATPTPEPHVHEYTETVTRQPSCNADGEKQLVCQGCGDVKVEAIPATGEHNWEPIYQNVTHPSTGHVEQRETQTQIGTSEPYTIYSCAFCGAQFDTPSGVSDHCKTFIGVDNGHAVANTIAYDYPGQPIYETVTESVWIVDTPETITQELVGYKCSVCGASK